MTREEAIATVRAIASDMEIAENSHVRRQGRRLQKALNRLAEKDKSK